MSTQLKLIEGKIAKLENELSQQIKIDYPVGHVVEWRHGCRKRKGRIQGYNFTPWINQYNLRIITSTGAVHFKSYCECTVIAPREGGASS